MYTFNCERIVTDSAPDVKECFFMNSTAKSNIQFYPAKQRIVPNCKLCKVIHNLTQDAYDYMVIGDKKRRIVEMRHHKRYGEINVIYKMSNAGGYDNTDPLTEFDRAVLSVCVSNFAVGNRCVTPAIIFRGLTGKSGTGGKGKIHRDQLVAILLSVKKLMSTIINIDDTQPNEFLDYGTKKTAILCSAILPAYIAKDTTINGQDAYIIGFDRESPLMQIARERKQILTYKAELLDVPGQHNTLMNIALKNYAVSRVQEIKLHKMHRTLTFADIFAKTRIADADREKKQNARNTLVKFFEHLQTAGEIRSFSVTRRGNTFHAIKFT